MGNYTYLMSSLQELKLFDPGRNFSSMELFLFCREQLSAADMEKIRRMFLMNDIRNTVYLNFNEKQSREDYVRPSYYDEDFFWVARQDHALFFPFLQRFYAELEGSAQAFPELPRADELAFFLYEDIESLVSGFSLQRYYIEREIRNLALALTEIHEGKPPLRRLIPSGIVYDAVALSANPADWQLEKSLPWASELLPLIDQPLELEVALEKIRWAWLDAQAPESWDSLEALMIYFARLQTVERWEALDLEAGKTYFNTLLNTLNRTINFAIEIANPGGIT